MRTIYKYKLKLDQKQGLRVPEGSKILTPVHVEGKSITIFALVDPRVTRVTRYDVYVVGTGQSMNEDPLTLGFTFLGTAEIKGKEYHVFCRIQQARKIPILKKED